ncbi:MAG: substrate-binding domain-containing protein [Rhodocyclaceae bacterium]
MPRPSNGSANGPSPSPPSTCGTRTSTWTTWISSPSTTKKRSAWQSNHLVALGHRSIAYATALPLSPSRQARLAGYRAAMSRHGLPTVEITREPTANQSPYGDTALADIGRAAAAEYLALSPRPTGIVCLNDMFAMGMAAGLRAAGLSIPGDVSLVGIDNISLCDVLSPGLTSVAQPFDLIAEAAVEQIVGRIRDPQQQPRETVLTPRLVERGSTAAPRA